MILAKGTNAARTRKPEGGFTLIETMIAMIVLTIGILSLAAMLASSLAYMSSSEYDYIVIDTPPVLSVTDAVVLAPYCDGVVLVVRSQVTIKKSLERVVELFARTQTRIIGTVLNGMDVRGADYYRHFGHKYIAEGSDYYAPEED